MSDGIFFFVKKKVNHSVFWSETYRRFPLCCNNINIISASQSKVEKTEFFIVFSTFDRDPEIIMKWFQRHGNSRQISPQKRIRVSWILRKKNFRFPKGVSGSVSKSENDHFRMSDGIFFFLWKKKSIIVFFGVKFTGDSRDVAIISTLFRHHSQKSKKPNFSSFFRLLTVIPK